MTVLNYKLHIIYSLSFALTHRRTHIPPPPYTHNYLNTSAHAWSISASRPIISWRMQRHLKCKSRLSAQRGGVSATGDLRLPVCPSWTSLPEGRDGDYRRGRQEAGLFPSLDEGRCVMMICTMFGPCDQGASYSKAFVYPPPNLSPPNPTPPLSLEGKRKGERDR